MLPFTRPSLGDAELQAVRDVLESGWITSGPKVQMFEAALADYVGGQVGVLAFNSATSGLEAILLAADIGPGDEVIVPAMSFVATANVVIRVGARPVFVDVELQSRNINVAAITAAITEKTRAILPVHFAGRAADMAAINKIAKAHGLLVIEDAAQAIGTEYNGERIGASGNPVCFSFHPNKNITTIEGGAVACSDTEMQERLQRLRFHGIVRDEEGNMDVPEWGGKMNLPDVGAAIGLIQLARLDQFNRRRRELAKQYLERLPSHPALVLPQDVAGHSWHMFCVCIDFDALGTTRAAIQQQFQAKEIGVGIHYPAMHLFSLYRRMGYTVGDFPVAEQIGNQTLTLPLFPTMHDDDVMRVCNSLEQILNEANG
ncbi:MAG: DegT/DnrJ/EryC1/StrS family aminotransferase [Gammaproteobacteria bacterium]